LQLLSRLQKRTALVRIPLYHFQSEHPHHAPIGDTAPQDAIEILLEEHNDLWINICDIFKFIHTPDTTHRHTRDRRRKDLETQFIWSSENTGYRHLYLITKHRDEKHARTQPITSGDWCVLDKPISVDRQRKLVYFMGKRETPLESHFYVASYAEEHLSDNGSPIARLSELGFSRSIVMDNLCQHFVDTYSNMETAPTNVVRIIHHDGGNDILPRVKHGCYSLQPSIPCLNEDDDDDVPGIMKPYHDGQFMESIPGPKVGYCHPRLSTRDMLSGDSNSLLPAVVGDLPKGQVFSFTNSDGKYCMVGNTNASTNR
jgi:hypothetical protein